MARFTQLESKARDGVTVDSVINVIECAPGTTTWDGKTTIASAFASPGDDYEDSAFKASPRIDSISPTSGPVAGGTAVTIVGRRLDFGTLTVEFAAAAGTNVRDRLYAHATADSPAGTGTVAVKVKNEWGETVLASAFTYT